MEKPLVSVIIVNWDGVQFLEDCLGTILKNDYPNFEVVFVDCASKDGSADYVKNKFRDKKLKLVELKKDPGFDPANNLAVREYAKGDYILLLNNDTKVPKNLISEMMKYSGENIVVNPIQYNFEGKFVSPYYEHIMIGKPLYLKLSKLGIYKKVFPEKPKPFYASIACCLLPRKLFLKIPFNENFNLYEDFLWGWQLFLSGAEFRFAKSTYFKHKIVGSTFKPKAGYNVGLAVSAAHYICLSLPTFLIVYPYIFSSLFFIWTYISIKNKNPIALLSYLLGVKDFFKKLNFFRENKKKFSKYKLYGDSYSLKRMVLGSRFLEEQNKEFGVK